MLTFLRSLFAEGRPTARPRLSLESLDGRIVPAALATESPPIVADTSDGAPQTPTQSLPPNWAPSQPPFTGTMAPSQTPPQYVPLP